MRVDSSGTEACNRENYCTVIPLQYMDVRTALRERIDVRDFDDSLVDKDEQYNILDAARVASSGRNTQHWRFVLVSETDRLQELGSEASSCEWISGAAFAVAVLTNPDWHFHEIDAGKAITHMQLAAWEGGIASCMCTTDSKAVRDLLDVPDGYDLTAVVGFGYPDTEIKGIKDRESLDAVASEGTFGSPIRDNR